MKSKDLAQILTDEGIEYKSQKNLDSTEFAILFDKLTRDNQIKGIEDYLDGVTYIPSKEVKKAEEAAAVAPEDVKAEEVKAKPSDEVKQEKDTSEEPKKETKKEVKAKEIPAEGVSKAEEKKTTEAVKAEPKKPEPKKEEAAKEHSSAQTVPTSRTAYNNATVAPQQGQYQRAGGGYGANAQQNRGERTYNQNTAFSRGDKPFGAQAGAQRPAQQGGFKNAQQQKGGYTSGGKGGFDKDERVQSGPKDTFKRKEIIRGQGTNTDNTPKQRGATRVVDMRSTSVDLSKYDEKLDNFVPESVSDMRGGMQRVKKQGAANTFGAKNNKFKGKKSTQPVTKAPTSVTLPDEIIVSDLASRLKVTSAEVVKRLMLLGMMVTVNQTVDYDTAAIVADEMGIAATKEVVVTIEERLFEEEEDNESNLLPRAPVVCVMGHVDHGKTSILDAIRHTNVTRGEAGGITQHIGAYSVKVNGNDITFLDTPGHEAFTAMRARGAQSTDIAILVVAADDGIMPQTIEAINHAKAAGIDIVVAINKMDKPTANPENVKQELTKYELVPEEWGGDIICVPVSALTGQGIDDLLESVLLVAEVKDLKANPNRLAKGLVIEAKLDKGRGPVATVLVQNGTLHNGDVVIAGTAVGRVRAMTDYKGKNVKDAKPSVAVEIIGLSEVPSSGDEFNAVKDERMARELADKRRAEAKEEVFKANARANLNDLFAQISDGVKELNIIVKADVAGSVEAVKQSLEKLSNDEVKVRVIHGAAGGIREGDVTFAAASNAIIVGFNVRPDKAAIDSAERQGVDIRTYRVIYDCINEISDAMKGMLAPEFRENILGHAEVRQTIHVPNVGTIAGSYIQDGKVSRNAMIRVVRDGVVIFEDKISSLKRFKDDAKEVAQGYECGIGLERFNDIKVGDILEAYIMEEVER